MPEIPVRAFLVSVVVVRKIKGSPEVLLLKRAESLAGTWCQIAGSIEENETGWQAALRELREETGLEPISFYSADICEQFYEPDRDVVTIAPVFVAFIDKQSEVILNQEHTDYRWLRFDEACQLVSFGGQRKVLRWIEDEFFKREPSEYLRIEWTTLPEDQMR